MKQLCYNICMKDTILTKQLSATEELLIKIKKLQVDKVYSVSQITNNSDKNRVYLSRLADKGVIVKVSKGYFYKPTSMTLYKKSDITVPLQKSIFVNDLFWSVGNGFEVNANTLIKAYLLNPTEDDLMALYSLFGYKRLLHDCLKLYKVRTNREYKKIRAILERFEKWRLDDK